MDIQTLYFWCPRKGGRKIVFNFVRRFGWVSVGLGLVLALVPMGAANAASAGSHVVLADGGHHGSHSGGGDQGSQGGNQGNQGGNQGNQGGNQGNQGGDQGNQGGSGSGANPTPTPETPYAALFPIAIAGGALWVYRKRRAAVWS